MKRDKRVNLSSYEHEPSVERATGALNGSTILYNVANTIEYCVLIFIWVIRVMQYFLI